MSIKELLKLDVSKHTEQKGKLTYLSWTWAWDYALKADEQATYKVEMFGDKCYIDINGTAMVFVTVTLFGKPITCQLPVMDFRNNAIPKPDAFAVNTAIMRCMTKGLSLHGLGLYIYAGEDLPTEHPVKNLKEKGSSKDLTAPKHKATDGALVNEEQKQLMRDVAMEIIDHIQKDDVIGAFEEASQVIDQEEKTYLWSLLDSKVRTAITNHRLELDKQEKLLKGNQNGS